MGLHLHPNRKRQQYCGDATWPQVELRLETGAKMQHPRCIHGEEPLRRLVFLAAHRQQHTQLRSHPCQHHLEVDIDLIALVL